MLEKSRSMNVDCVAFDLEDSVTPGLKPTARAMVKQHLFQSRFSGIRDHAVRINAIESGLALQDLTELVSFDRIAWHPPLARSWLRKMSYRCKLQT
jgi:citrate lyase subunit beta-like protein